MKTTTEQYTEFILSLRDTVFRLALSITGSQVEAEDITQDIYEKVWRARDKVLQSAYPRAYVCRMARNLAIDRVRLRRTTTEIADSIVEDGNSRADVTNLAEYPRQIIARLPEKQQVAVHMRDVEGYEIDEIAEVLECDSASVRTNLSRARKSIREQLLKVISYGTE